MDEATKIAFEVLKNRIAVLEKDLNQSRQDTIDLCTAILKKIEEAVEVILSEINAIKENLEPLVRQYKLSYEVFIVQLLNDVETLYRAGRIKYVM